MSSDLTSPGSLSASSPELSAALQHPLSFVGHARVDATRVPRSRFPLVGRTLVAPLTGSDIGRVKPLVVDLAGTPGADRKALVWAQETFPSTISKHHGALVPLRRDTTPSGPRHTPSPTITATFASLCHSYIICYYFSRPWWVAQAVR
jgi:hypothetical protein